MLKDNVQDAFRKSFDEFVYKRTEVILFPLMSCECGKKRNRLFDEIKVLLDAEKQRLMFDYEDLESEYVALASETAYKQGLIDGLSLKNVIKDEMGAVILKQII